MTVDLKMMYSNMEVNVDLSNIEGYEVNNSSILSKLEELLDHLSHYTHVSVVIKSGGEQEKENDDTPKYSLDRYFNDINPIDTFPGIRSGSTMNG